MPRVVRLATPAEHDAVGRLTPEAYAANGYLVEDDFYAAHLLDAASRAADAELVVAELNREMAGTVTFCPGPVQREAHALYRSLGFARVPNRDWSPAPGVNLIGFRRPL